MKMDVDELLKESMAQLEHLPAKVAKHTAEIGDLDKKCNEIQSKIRVRLAAHIKSLRRLKKEQKAKNIKEIHALFNEAERICQKKIKIANTLYDSVDADITTFDRANAALQANRPVPHNEEDEAGPSDGRKKKSKKKGGKGRKEMKTPPVVIDNTMPPLPTVEMPVDPNEPTYCVCHQVSFGQMIGCDNQNCKTEWFHFQCVGLTETPNGSWYCDVCKTLFKGQSGTGKKRGRKKVGDA